MARQEVEVARTVDGEAPLAVVPMGAQEVGMVQVLEAACEAHPRQGGMETGVGCGRLLDPP